MIYWDNNATTPLAPQVLEAMLPFLQGAYFNPSAAYGPAKEVRRAIEQAREQVAALLGAAPMKLYSPPAARRLRMPRLLNSARC